MNDICNGCVVVGGLLSESEFYGTEVMVIDGQYLPVASFTMQRTKGSVPIEFVIGENSTNQRAWSVRAPLLGDYWGFEFDDDYNCWCFRRNGRAVWSMDLPTTLANSRATDAS